MRRETPAECFPPNAPLKPLPAGSLYPEFKSYNKKVVDFQMAERQRLEEEERALLRKRQVGNPRLRSPEAVLCNTQNALEQNPG